MRNIITKHLSGVFLFMLLFTATIVSAQRMNNTLYLMQNVPQSNQLNPAIQPECKVFVGFPALSSIYVNYSNSSFAYKDIIHQGTGLQKDSLVIDMNSFHDALQTRNFISQQVDITLFALGIRAKNMFFSLDVIERNDLRFSFDKEMITFLKDGNYNFRGKTSNWGGLGLDAAHYRELGLGISRKINDQWTVGIRPKLLFGIANLNMDQSEISVYTSSTGDLIRLQSKQRMNVSLPIDRIDYDANGYVDDLNFNSDDYGADFAMNTQNMGMALDLGVTYKMDEKTTLYASITDLGFINWKSDTYQFTQDATYEYTGMDLNQSGNSNAPDYKPIEDVLDDLTDDLKDRFKLKDDINTYKTNLPTQIYLGGTYQTCKKLNLGALNRTEIYNGKVQSSLTLSANARLIKNISTSMSYSIVNNSYNNLGFGLATKLGPLQLYMVSDNIMAGINPKSAQNMNFRFGLNLLFGCKDKTKQIISCELEDSSPSKKPLYQ